MRATAAVKLWAALAPLALMLNGCVAAALPLLAGGMIARKETKADAQTPTPPPVKPIVEVMASDYSLPAAGGMVGDTAPARTIPVMLIPPTATPTAPPAELIPQPGPVAAPTAIALAPAAPADGSTPYAAFARYAVAHAPPLPAGKKRRSALVDQDSITSEPRLAECGDGPPAVVVDLDKGAVPFDLADAPFPATGLAEQLAAIRGAGLTVLWSASLPVADAQKLYTVLRASGLDPDRTDRLLLSRNPDEGKQLRRIAAARDWCILAVAGDQRGDFDELYEYLRDPNGPIAAALEPTFGDGWFLVPPPID